MMTLSCLIERFVRWTASHRAAKTAAYYRQQLGKALQLIGDRAADQIKAADLVELPASWHLIQALQRMYRWACKEAKIVKKNPVKKIPKPRLGMRRRVLTRAELLRLLRDATPAVRAFLLALRESSARPQEVRALRWEYLRYPPWAGCLQFALLSGQAWFELTDYKARDRRKDPGTPRVIPVSPRLGRHLLRQLERTASTIGPVFLNARHEAWRKNTIVCALRRLRVKAGLALPVGSGSEQVCCYTFRHTTATNLAAAGMATHTLQTLLGHADIETTLRYLHLNNAALMKSWTRWHRGEDPAQEGHEG